MIALSSFLLLLPLFLYPISALPAHSRSDYISGSIDVQEFVYTLSFFYFIFFFNLYSYRLLLVQVGHTLFHCILSFWKA